MPSYLPATYQPYGYSGVGQQMYPQYQNQMQTQQMQTQQMQGTPAQTGPGLIWVDGEVGAKAYQMPQGWPCNQPIALWDTNDTTIYLKSTNPMGMPNPLQKAHYTLEEQRGTNRMQSTESQESRQTSGEYVRKEDLERMKQEILDTINGMNTSGTTGRRTSSKGE